MSISLKSNQLSSYPVSLQPFWTIGLLLHIKLASCLNFLFIFYRVCRQWKKCSRCPLLWRKVDVTVNQGSGSQTEMAVDFSKTLPSSVTHLKLKFWHKFHSSDKEIEFCGTLWNIENKVSSSPGINFAACGAFSQFPISGRCVCLLPR